MFERVHTWRPGTITWPVVGLLRWCNTCGLHWSAAREELACEGPPPSDIRAVDRPRPRLVVDNTRPGQPPLL